MGFLIFRKPDLGIRGLLLKSLQSLLQPGGYMYRAIVFEAQIFVGIRLDELVDDRCCQLGVLVAIANLDKFGVRSKR